MGEVFFFFFFFSSRRRHTRLVSDWSSDVCSSDLIRVRAYCASPPMSADAQYALTLIRAWDGEARADSGATLVLELTRQALLQRLLGPKLGPDVSIYHWGLSTVFLQNVLKNRWARWLPPGDAD